MGWALAAAAVAVALVLWVTGFLLGRRGVRMARRQAASLRELLDETTLAADRANRRAELAEAGRDAERVAVTDAQAELVAVVGAKRRLEQRVEELEARLRDELDATGALRQQAAAATAWREELDRIRVQLAEVGELRRELALSEQYVETLQRELTYRDEHVLRLEDRLDALPATEPVDVIDLTGDLTGDGSGR